MTKPRQPGKPPCSHARVLKACEQPAETSNALLEAALTYADRGWPVFPLAPRGKNPLSTHGHLDATIDADQIRAWWSHWPDANVGIATGRRSSLLVLDLDGPKGDAALIELGAAVATLTSITARGRHLYFRHAHGVGCSTTFRPQVHVRGDGGYIVGPPSVHETGVEYQWDDEHDMGWGTNPAPLPEPLRRALLDARGKSQQELSNRGLVSEGMRNTTLTALAGSVAARAGHRQQVLQEVLAYNQARCDPPLPEREVRKIVKSIWGLECRYRKNGGRASPGPVPGPDVKTAVDWTALNRTAGNATNRLLKYLGYFLDLTRLIVGKAEMPIQTGHRNARPAYVADGEAEISIRYLANRWGLTYKTIRVMLRHWEALGWIKKSPETSRVRLAEGCGISTEAWADLLRYQRADLQRDARRGSKPTSGTPDERVGADLLDSPGATSTTYSTRRVAERRRVGGSRGGGRASRRRSRQAGGPGLELDVPIFLDNVPVPAR